MISSLNPKISLPAVQSAVRELAGAYAIAVISADEKEKLVVARMGAPLLLGIGEGENYAASDMSALLQVTRQMIYLEEGMPIGWNHAISSEHVGGGVVDLAGGAAHDPADADRRRRRRRR